VILPLSSLIVNSLEVCLTSFQVVGILLPLCSKMSSFIKSVKPSYSKGIPTREAPFVKSATVIG